MKRKIMHKDFIVNLKDGSSRHVLVVGVLDKVKTPQLFNTPVFSTENQENVGTAFITEKVLTKRLTLLYTICEPEDEFNLKTGMDLVLSRVGKKHLGVIESTDFTMLREEHINALIDSEVAYITKNIDKIIAKKEQERCRKQKQKETNQK